MKHKLKRLLARRPLSKPEPEKSLDEAIQNIPRITNETVAEHREEVLSSARKFIYPLQHSLRRIVGISAGIFALLVFAFVVYCLLALYRFDTTSTFIYRVTQVVPLPVAKAGPNYVAYENYLFELRHYMHYYQTQQNINFDDEQGRQQLEVFRKVALESVINDAYIKQLAHEHKLTVSDRELNDQITLLRNQNRLGSSNEVFEDVLKEFWGWSLGDFKRELRQQLLAQKVISALDVNAHNRANDVLNLLNNGGDFAALAKQYSEDLNTKEGGGDYGVAIDQANRNLSPQVVDQLFSLQSGQISGIVDTPLGLEILKVTEKDGSTVRAAHIFIAFQDVNSYIKPLQQKHPFRAFISPSQ